MPRCCYPNNLLCVVCHQMWNDERLTWNDSKFDNISHIVVKSDQIWKPDIVLRNRSASLGTSLKYQTSPFRRSPDVLACIHDGVTKGLVWPQIRCNEVAAADSRKNNVWYNYDQCWNWPKRTVGVSCRNVWNFAQGLKFKSRFSLKMNVCRHELWGFNPQPPPPDNSNPDYDGDASITAKTSVLRICRNLLNLLFYTPGNNIVSVIFWTRYLMLEVEQW